MFGNKKNIKFLQKSKNSKCDIICVTILENCDFSFKKSIKSMFINSNYESVGFDFNIDLRNHVLSLSNDVLESKEGRFISFHKSSKENKNSWNKEISVNCWIEPFYLEDNYGSIGRALENISKGIKSTLIRSTKYTSIHSFTPDFCEDDNSFTSSKNLFFERIDAPIKILLLGDSRLNMEILKNAEILGCQVCFCDLKGKKLKKIKIFDEIILLNSLTSLKKVFDKNFDVAIMADTQANCNLYLNDLLNSTIPNISIINTTNKAKAIVDAYDLKNNISSSSRVEIFSADIEKSIEKIASKIALKRENEIKVKKKKSYEYI